MAKHENLTCVGVRLAVCKMGVLWCLPGGVTVRIHRDNLWKVRSTVPGTWGALASKEPQLIRFLSLHPQHSLKEEAAVDHLIMQVPHIMYSERRHQRWHFRQELPAFSACPWTKGRLREGMWCAPKHTAIERWGGRAGTEDPEPWPMRRGHASTEVSEQPPSKRNVGPGPPRL